MIITDTEEHLQVGDVIGFCPDLDRGAEFSIEKIEPLPNKEVEVSLKYIKGRWSPDDREKLFKFVVPEDFTTLDIECAWLEIPNFTRLTM